MIRSASVWRFGVVGSNGGAISWSSSIRPVCPMMVDQTFRSREAVGASDTRNSEIANRGHDPVRSYAFRQAAASLAVWRRCSSFNDLVGEGEDRGRLRHDLGKERVHIPAMIIGSRVADKLPVKAIRTLSVIVFTALDALIPKAELVTLPKHGGPIIKSV
jgi:hypothetical protein